MDNRDLAYQMIQDMSEVKFSYVMRVLNEVINVSDMEIEKRNDRIRALRDLTDYFQELSKPWKNEEELFAEMTVERRKKRAALA